MTWLVPRELKALGTESWLSPFLLAQVSFNVSDLLTTVQWCTMNTSGQHSFPKKREWSKSKAIHRMLEDGNGKLHHKWTDHVPHPVASPRTYLERKADVDSPQTPEQTLGFCGACGGSMTFISSILHVANSPTATEAFHHGHSFMPCRQGTKKHIGFTDTRLQLVGDLVQIQCQKGLLASLVTWFVTRLARVEKGDIIFVFNAGGNPAFL